MTRKIDFGGEDWSAHSQVHWADFAADPNVPDVLRVVFVAYARHKANGHARLRQGELAHFLVRKDGTLPDRRNIKRAIDQAIDRGYLSPESRVLCLVVSSLHVQGGIGDPDRPCDRDHTSRRQKDITQRRRFEQKDITTTGRFEQKDITQRRRFEPSSSLFSYPDNQPPQESAS